MKNFLRILWADAVSIMVLLFCLILMTHCKHERGIKMLSAYQARQMMPNKKATKLVEYVLSGVPARAKNGHYDITVGCPDNIYTEHDIEIAEAQLKKLGYNINHAYGSNSV